MAPTARASRFAKELRAGSTPPERVLWSRLRNRRLGGFKFRRQHPIGAYIADFFCDEARLVIEIDSSYHTGRLGNDAARDAWMRSHGIEVRRVRASDLATNEDGVLSMILDVSRERLCTRGAEISEKG